MVELHKSARPACLLLVLAAALVLSGHGWNAAADGANSAYEVRMDLLRLVGWLQGGGKPIYGHLDAAGNFLPEDTLSAPVVNRPVQAKEAVYEYRSGNLIKGTLRQDGGFIPELGSKVTTLKDYLKTYDPENSPRIYNLPGFIVKKGQETPPEPGK